MIVDLLEGDDISVAEHCTEAEPESPGGQSIQSGRVRPTLQRVEIDITGREQSQIIALMAQY